MSNSIYLATTKPHTGKSLVSLGLADLLLRRTSCVGVFRPLIGGDSSRRDKNIDLLLTHFNLNLNYDDTFAFTRREAAELIGLGKYDEVLDRIIEKFRILDDHCDFVLCIGSDLAEGTAVLEFDFNADVAKNLGAPVLIITSAEDREPADVVSSVSSNLAAFNDRGCQVIGVIVNRAEIGTAHVLRTALAEELSQRGLLSVIPNHKTLSCPTLKEKNIRG